jgi:ABC-type glycerol-3-phosphate transport system substrate-binding protein
MMNPEFEYGVILPPPISKKYPLKIWGSAGSSLMVNETSPNKDKAIAFLKWISEKEQQVFLSEATKNLPANQNALVSLPKELGEFGRGMEFSTHPSIWSEEEDALVKEKFLKGLQSIIIGERTPEQVAQEVQEAKERQMDRALRRR